SRRGRVIQGRLECGEEYLFESAGSDGLREVLFTHSELTRAEALKTADLMIRAVEPPPDAGAPHKICIDCGDPGEQLAAREWTHEGETNILEVYLRSGEGTFVVAVTWWRHRW